MMLKSEPVSYDLGIVIVNYRTPDLVIDCLTSLMPELDQLNAKVIVVDNHSPDNSLSLIDKAIKGFSALEQSKLLLLDSGFNAGFSAGNNVGINAVAARHYLLLNSDTIVRVGAIAKLLSTIEARPHVGMVGPRLEYLNEEPQQSCFRFHGVLSELMRGAQLSFLARLFRNSVVALELGDASSSIEWTSFACVLIRREVLEQVELLDDGYFMYFEDVEFCSRMKRHGWQIANEPVARIVHLRGGSSPVKANTAMRKRLPKYYYESRTRYFYHRGGRSYLLMANLAWSAGRMLCKLKTLIGRDDKSAIDREWRDIWTNFSRPLAPYTHPSK